MAIDRAQLEQQIVGLSGDPVEEYGSGTGLKPLDAQQLTESTADQASLDNLVSALNNLSANRSRTALPEDVMRSLRPRPYEENVNRYKSRLDSIYQSAPRPGFYDMASELGRALLSSDPTLGAFRGLGIGFSNFNELLKKTDEENRKTRQAVGIEAAKLAMDDERKAEERLRDFAIEVYTNQNFDDIDPLTLQYEEMDEEGNFTGKKVTGTFDKKQDAQEILRIMRNQRGVDITALPVVEKETALDKEFARQFVAEYKKISEAAGTGGYAKLDSIDQAKLLAEEIGEENFGKSQEALLGLRQFVLDVSPWAADKIGIDAKTVANQEALASLTISFVLANVAGTKGAVSDSEMRLFKEASPYLGQSYGGFMLALEIQKAVARKKVAYAEAYKEEAARYLQQNPNDQGRGVLGHMARWTKDWEASAKASFLSPDMKERLQRFDAVGRKKYGTDKFDTSDFEKRQRDYFARKASENQQSANAAIQNSQRQRDVQQIRSDIQNNENLTFEQKEKLLRQLDEVEEGS
jgi:hypothetical protein